MLWLLGKKTIRRLSNISCYSGKYDFKDHLWMSAKTEEETFNKFNGTKLYICQPLPDDFSWEEALKNGINIPETYYKKVEYSSINDLIPYYPHIIALCAIDNTDLKSSVVCLYNESYVDVTEREILEFNLKRLLRIYNHCKRKKIEFDVEEALKEIVWNDGYNEESYRELANRVKENGKKANIDGIHLKMQEHYRQELADQMVKHGLNLADYGYERFSR